jgi:RNA polymerase sigma factor (sigma-70 family)
VTLHALWQAAAMLDERYLSQLPAHRGRLVRAAARLLGNAAEAEDVVQDTYLRALEGGDRPALDAAPAWLTTVMQNLAIDRLRRRNRMQQWLHDSEAQALTSETSSTEAHAALAQEIEQALRLLATRLSPADGAAVLLREVFEATYGEIAQASGKTEAACRQQLHRALASLRSDEAMPHARSGDEDDTAFHLLHHALRTREPQVLLAMLRQPATRASVRSTADLDRAAPKAVCQVTQLGGRLGLVLTLGGQLVCALPLGVQQAEETIETGC